MTHHEKPSLQVTISPPADPTRDDITSRATYQLFIFLVTTLALAVTAAYYLLPLPEPVRQVLYILNAIIAFVLLYDFFVQLYYARNRLQYMVTFGWLDLLGSVPGIPWLRAARIPSLVVHARALFGTNAREARRAARKRLAESTLLAVVFVVLLVVTTGSILVVLVEAPAPGANILTGEDAVWWSIVTVATVGYGDRYPVTTQGRVIGTVMIIMGVSLFSVLTSYIATQFMARRKASGPSETALLRAEMIGLFEEQRRLDQSETAALRAELAELRRLLGAENAKDTA
jgi:voltage-gated potassium channel